MAASRTRTFATVVYPESAPDDWISILARLCIPAFVSPLHDSDKNPTGEDKKAHYHVLFMFDGVKTREQCLEVIESIGGVGCEMVQSVRAYSRYLCHLDNPDKQKYDVEKVQSFGGADYVSIIGLSVDRYRSIKDMMNFCKDNGIHSYALLCDWCAENRMDWFRLLCDNASYVMKEYMKSLSWTNKEENSNDC